jgi:two-component system sensor histidine kinase ChiS
MKSSLSTAATDAAETNDDEPLFGEDERTFDGDGPMSFEKRRRGEYDASSWKVLVVDDDPEVLSITRLALRDLKVDNKPLRIESASSAAEARGLLQLHPDAAVALVDVVMESDDAGLSLVRHIREELQNGLIRIVLRTGQPGTAPEERVMTDFDINDYRSKTELTAPRLRTAMTGAIRSFRDLRTLEGQRLDIERMHVELRELLGAFGLFVPQELLRLLGRADVRSVRVGDHVSLEMAVLFCDVRSFTAMAEELTPEETFLLVNDLFRMVAPAIEEAGGVVDKYLGDGLMALFPTGGEAAVRAAIRMLSAMREAGAERPEARQLSIAVGIHSGPLILGTVGHERRLDTTVISDAVNVASRLEKLTRHFDVPLLVSEQVAAELGPELRSDVRRLGTTSVRGKRAPVSVVEVFASDPPELAAAKRESREAFEEAVLALDKRDFEEAAEMLRAIAQACPGDRAAASLLADCEQLLDGRPLSSGRQSVA